MLSKCNEEAFVMAEVCHRQCTPVNVVYIHLYHSVYSFLTVRGEEWAGNETTMYLVLLILEG